MAQRNLLVGGADRPGERWATQIDFLGWSSVRSIVPASRNLFIGEVHQ
jgi:hypothetical protein